ncbi:hypothetical protein Tco_1328915 [Tanacetum coccineum]
MTGNCCRPQQKCILEMGRPAPLSSTSVGEVVVHRIQDGFYNKNVPSVFIVEWIIAWTIRIICLDQGKRRLPRNKKSLSPNES